MNLDEKDYKKYLCLAYKIRTNRKLNLKSPKTLNEKIQWLKLNDNSLLKTQLTDKILVRDWVKNKIGENYLKPVLWIGDRFDNIPFESLPNRFIIKCNHGCKWHIVIKDKTKFLLHEDLVQKTKMQFDLWIRQTFFGYSDFETQYRTIKPQILIEPLMRENINEAPEELSVWCINQKTFIDEKQKEYREELLSLSKILSENFKLVRVDWMPYNNKLYFEEMTFTPLSGFLSDYMLEKDIFKEINKNLKI